MKKSDFYYDLPEELIAQTPVEPRDSSRLLVYDEGNVAHRHFRDIKDYLRAGDVLVVNNTRVIPARLYGAKPTGALVEVLLLKRLDLTRWEVILRPGKRLKTGSKIIFSEELSATVVEHLEDGGRVIECEFEGVFEDILARVGTTPLPPYIKETLADPERYQTVYSKINGSAAAPTAGLHFTPELIAELKAQGVEFAEVLLHVGLSTFRPVSEDDVEKHEMHFEYYEMNEQTAQIINCAKAEGRRVIAVGTTSVRTLETVADENGYVKPQSGDTNIFIYPPYKFKCVNGLITNFHLPESTLIMLVASLVGYEEILKVYNLAVQEKYRFFSFGDACLFI